MESKNRELKFRIVHKSQVNGFERLTHKVGSIHWEWMCLDLNPDNGSERWTRGVYPDGYNYIRQQFTGLLDKNKKEIYEGDILQFCDKPVAIVVYQDFGGWSYQWIDPAYKTIRQQNPEPFFRNINLNEVIGNIFENPELLK